MNEVPVPEQTPRPSSASVNPADVDRFNRLGDLWWDATGKMGILHEINPIRVDYVRDLAVRYLHRDRFSAQPLIMAHRPGLAARHTLRQMHV